MAIGTMLDRTASPWKLAVVLGPAAGVIVMTGCVTVTGVRIGMVSRPGGWSVEYTAMTVAGILLIGCAIILVTRVDRTWSRLAERHRRRVDDLRWTLDATSRELDDERRELRAQRLALTRERRQVEALRKERDFATAVLHNAVALVVVYDRDGVIVGFNSACERLTGFTEDQVVGLGFWETLLAPHSIPVFGGELERLRTDRSARTVEVGWLDRDNRTRRIAFTTSVLDDAAGEPTFYVATGADVTEQRCREDQLRRMADTDPLTGLVNRATLRRHLDVTLRDPHNRGGVALLFCDLDNFKEVNDTRGHAVGDALLVEVARRLRESVRSKDMVARLGGDEFVIVCPEYDADDTARLARRLTQRIERPYRVDGGIVRVGVSVGTALACADVDADKALRQADVEMYRHKAARRRRARELAGFPNVTAFPGVAT